MLDRHSSALWTSDGWSYSVSQSDSDILDMFMGYLAFAFCRKCLTVNVPCQTGQGYDAALSHGALVGGFMFTANQSVTARTT